ncbi:MAG TPA: hypothetical protein VHO06_09865 [Polyangia bacterium]|nr:hypothetical protein [Polyangia bacterium]
MDAMDEGSGGRGWEKLAPEERAKLLRDRQGGGPEGSRRGAFWIDAERRPARMAGYFGGPSPSR